MDRLPVELLGIIFENVRPHVPSFLEDDESFPDNLLVISAVCKRWRNVARGTRSLWTDIDAPHRKADQLGLMFLTLSNPLPLRIALTRYEDTFVATLFQDHSSRIQFLDCYVLAASNDEGPSKHHTLPGCLNLPAPRLEELHIVSESFAAELGLDSAPMQLLFAGHTPQLKKLDLQGMPWLVANQLDRLTHLQIQGLDSPDWDFIPELLTMLSRCPVLEELFLSTLRQEEPPVAALPMVTLSHLRRLAIGDPYVGALINVFLSHVSLPEDGLAVRLFNFDPHADYTWLEAVPHLAFMEKLTAVRFSTVMGPEAIMTGPSAGLRLEYATLLPCEHLHILRLHEHPCPLTELWLDERWIDLTDLALVLQHIPALTTLVITEGVTPEWFADAADDICSVLITNTDCCPRLATLRLWLHSSVFPAEIAELAAARAEQGHPLERLLVEYEDGADPAMSPLCLDDLARSVRTVEVRVGAEPSMHVPNMCAEDDPWSEEWPAW